MLLIHWLSKTGKSLESGIQVFIASGVQADSFGRFGTCLYDIHGQFVATSCDGVQLNITRNLSPGIIDVKLAMARYAPAGNGVLSISEAYQTAIVLWFGNSMR